MTSQYPYQPKLLRAPHRFEWRDGPAVPSFCIMPEPAEIELTGNDGDPYPRTRSAT